MDNLKLVEQITLYLDYGKESININDNAEQISKKIIGFCLKKFYHEDNPELSAAIALDKAYEASERLLKAAKGAMAYQIYLAEKTRYFSVLEPSATTIKEWLAIKANGSTASMKSDLTFIGGTVMTMAESADIDPTIFVNNLSKTRAALPYLRMLHKDETSQNEKNEKIKVIAGLISNKNVTTEEIRNTFSSKKKKDVFLVYDPESGITYDVVRSSKYSENNVVLTSSIPGFSKRIGDIVRREE